MVLTDNRRIIEGRRGRRFVTLVAFLLLAAQAVIGLHAAAHATVEGSATCQVCLKADQPMTAAPKLISLGVAISCDIGPSTVNVSFPCRKAFSLPPTRGPPAHS
jgi:hypothetical protein